MTAVQTWIIREKSGVCWVPINGDGSRILRTGCIRWSIRTIRCSAGRMGPGMIPIRMGLVKAGLGKFRHGWARQNNLQRSGRPAGRCSGTSAGTLAGTAGSSWTDRWTCTGSGTGSGTGPAVERRQSAGECCWSRSSGTGWCRSEHRREWDRQTGTGWSTSWSIGRFVGRRPRLAAAAVAGHTGECRMAGRPRRRTEPEHRLAGRTRCRSSGNWGWSRSSGTGWSRSVGSCWTGPGRRSPGEEQGKETRR